MPYGIRRRSLVEGVGGRFETVDLGGGEFVVSGFVPVGPAGVAGVEDQAQLFNRFSRIETVTHVQGTGLGLWLSKEIARMHDGDLTVESQAGLGTKFTFSVPLSQ